MFNYEFSIMDYKIDLQSIAITGISVTVIFLFKIMYFRIFYPQNFSLYIKKTTWDDYDVNFEEFNKKLHLNSHESSESEQNELSK